MAKEFAASNGVEFRLVHGAAGDQVQWRNVHSISNWERVGTYNFSPYSKVSIGLREYFDYLDNYVEPKPWLEAKPGEVWDMETTQGEDYRVAVVLAFDGEQFVRLSTGIYYDLDDPIFTGGEKVFVG